MMCLIAWNEPIGAPELLALLRVVGGELDGARGDAELQRRREHHAVAPHRGRDVGAAEVGARRGARPSPPARA